MTRMRRRAFQWACCLALVVLVAGFAGTTLEVPTLSTTQAAAKDKGKGGGGGQGSDARHDGNGDDEDGNGDDNGKGKDDDQGQENRGQGQGHGKEKDKDKDKGKDEDANEPVQVVVVQPAPDLKVTVGCLADAGAGRSTCVFAGVAPAGEAVAGIAVPEATVCARVVAGDFARAGIADGDAQASAPGDAATWYTTGSAYRGPAYVSNGHPNVLTLVLDGTVTTTGTATYWLRTANGVGAAPGPGLRCAPAQGNTTNLAAATGSIVIQTFACDAGTKTADAATLDWFAACPAPVAGATFELTALDGDNQGRQRRETAGDDGVLRAGDLTPGHYQVVQIGANWCHAESDSVDDQGRVVVAAGQRASVWIFDCTPTQDAAAAATAPAN
jgi:hypothetical protein